MPSVQQVLLLLTLTSYIARCSHLRAILQTGKQPKSHLIAFKMSILYIKLKT